MVPARLSVLIVQRACFRGQRCAACELLPLQTRSCAGTWPLETRDGFNMWRHERWRIGISARVTNNIGLAYRGATMTQPAKRWLARITAACFIMFGLVFAVQAEQ